jgi:DnaJ-class molecular chaperone
MADEQPPAGYTWCPTCEGYGEVERGYGDECYDEDCPDCDGTGKIEKEED